jgi:hypothetical protein
VRFVPKARARYEATVVMRLRPIVSAAIVLLVVGCTSAPPIPPPTGVQRVKVATPLNKSGRDLIISGKYDLPSLMGRKKWTVTQELGDCLTQALEDRGFTVVSGGDADVLTVIIERFDPDTTRYESVDAAIVARLTGPDGKELWSIRRAPWTVATRGAVDNPDAWKMAAKSVAEQLVQNWEPRDAPSDTDAEK